MNRIRLWPQRLAVLLLASVLAHLAAAADAAWSAQVEPPTTPGLARLALPGEALLQSRSPGLADLRLVDAQGRPLAFALHRPSVAVAAPQPGPALAAHPLSRTRGPAGNGGTLQVQVRSASGESAWVRLDGQGAAQEPLRSALVDTRQQAGSVSVLRLQGQWPANTPVTLQAFTSTDLQQWQPLPLRGSLLRMAGAPELDRSELPLAQPQALHGRYLRLDWDTPEVQLSRVTPLAAQQPPRPHVQAALPPPVAVDGGLEWELSTSTPVAGLQLAAGQPGTLVPVRVLARRAAGQPWAVLAQTTVFSLGTAQAPQTNPPLALGGATVGRLRVEPLRGLPPGAMSASVAFEPVELVFLAAGPAQLRIGQANASAADVPLASLAAALPDGTPDALPLARLGRVETSARATTGPSTWLPAQVAPMTAVLWAVLLLGVAVLGVVAWRLLRQLKDTAPR